MKALVIGNAKFTEDYIAASQIYPFFDHRQQLSRELGLTFQHFQTDKLSDLKSICQDNPADALFIRPDWREQPQLAEQTMANIRQTYPNTKIFLIDPFDQTSSMFFNVLPYVDRMIKYQTLKDLNQYEQPLAGGTVLTDYLVREMGYNLNGWHVSSPIPSGYVDRIDAGWFLSLIPEFKRPILRPTLSWFMPRKTVDLVCHVSLGPKDSQDWYGKLRMHAFRAITALPDRYSKAISGEFLEERTVSRRQYIRDLQRGRIAISPFGWGELSFRDYEAVRHHCLLMKPAVDHIATEPNIYIPHETYVPLKWDYSNLEEQCRYYLDHPEAADRIIQNARRAYADYYQQQGFVRHIAALLTPAPLSQAVEA
ncbi:MAG: hypothetical protein MUF72_17905 [Elainella sp. Prado103]|jgi:hypothetical protein|nr:hypothetical protein [Elainella sp. Prado103]